MLQAEAIAKGAAAAFKKYQKYQLYELSTWQKLFDICYSGSLFSLFKVVQDCMDIALGRYIDSHMQQYLTRIFTGEAVYKSCSRSF